MNANKIWVVEVLDSEKRKWTTTDHVGLIRSDVGVAIHDWRSYNPDKLRFRIKKYVAEADICKDAKRFPKAVKLPKHFGEIKVNGKWQKF